MKNTFSSLVAVLVFVATLALVPLAQTPAPQTPAAPAGQRRGGGGAGGGDPWPGKKKLLAIADVTTGFHHDSNSHALATIEKIGRDSGAYVTIIHTDSQLITKKQIAGQGKRYTGRGVNARTLD